MRTVTKAEILDGLRNIGVRTGMALEVHCAMGSLGWVEGGAEAVIAALMEAVGAEGTLVMPSLMLSPALPLSTEDKRLGLVSKIRILDDDDEKSAMGIVSDTFRHRPDVCTGPGVFRVSAWGKDAEKHAQGLQTLIDGGGYALMIGVDIYKLTAMHYMEDILPPEIGAIFAPSAEALKRYPPERWLIESGEPPVKAWYTIQERAFAKGYIHTDKIGASDCMFFRVKDVVGLYRQALERDPLGLYGLEQDQELTRQSGAGFSPAARSGGEGALEVRRADSDTAADEKTSRDVAGIAGIALGEKL